MLGLFFTWHCSSNNVEYSRNNFFRDLPIHQVYAEVHRQRTCHIWQQSRRNPTWSSYDHDSSHDLWSAGKKSSWLIKKYYQYKYHVRNFGKKTKKKNKYAQQDKLFLQVKLESVLCQIFNWAYIVSSHETQFTSQYFSHIHVWGITSVFPIYLLETQQPGSFWS